MVKYCSRAKNSATSEASITLQLRLITRGILPRPHGRRTPKLMRTSLMTPDYFS